MAGFRINNQLIYKPSKVWHNSKIKKTVQFMYKIGKVW